MITRGNGLERFGLSTRGISPYREKSSRRLNSEDESNIKVPLVLEWTRNFACRDDDYHSLVQLPNCDNNGNALRDGHRSLRGYSPWRPCDAVERGKRVDTRV